MKLRAMGAGLALFAFSSVASAIPIATVGGVDSLVSWGSPNSSEANEQQWVANYLGVDASTITYNQLSSSGGSAWQAVDEDSSLYAFNFGSLTPAFFLVKTGGNVGLSGGGGPYDHYLFSNDQSSLHYGVVDMDLFRRTNSGQVTIGIFSHVGISGNTNVTVPEPATLSLFGFGLAGVALSRFRRKPRQ